MQSLDEKIRISKLLYKEALKNGYFNDVEKDFILNKCYLSTICRYGRKYRFNYF